ncbi:hypothetical protein BLA34_21610 [Ralstonia solanacearum]|nr:hypothetical protein BLA34_21610 [Ralstonia solanacearum]
MKWLPITALRHSRLCLPEIAMRQGQQDEVRRAGAADQDRPDSGTLEISTAPHDVLWPSNAAGWPATMNAASPSAIVQS